MISEPLDESLYWWLPVKECLLLEDVNALPAVVEPAPIRPVVGQHYWFQAAPAGKVNQRGIDACDQSIASKVFGRIDKAIERVCCKAEA